MFYYQMAWLVECVTGIQLDELYAIAEYSWGKIQSNHFKANSYIGLL